MAFNECAFSEICGFFLFLVSKLQSSQATLFNKSLSLMQVTLLKNNATGIPSRLVLVSCFNLEYM